MAYLTNELRKKNTSNFNTFETTPSATRQKSQWQRCPGQTNIGHGSSGEKGVGSLHFVDASLQLRMH